MFGPNIYSDERVSYLVMVQLIGILFVLITMKLHILGLTILSCIFPANLS